MKFPPCFVIDVVFVDGVCVVNVALVKKVLAFIKRTDSMLMVYTGTAHAILMKVMMFLATIEMDMIDMAMTEMDSIEMASIDMVLIKKDFGMN